MTDITKNKAIGYRESPSHEHYDKSMISDASTIFFTLYCL
jgi:hypothetical protein